LQVQGRTPKTALQFVNGYLRVPGALRFLTDPVESKKPTPPFQWPEGKKPEAVVMAEQKAMERKQQLAEMKKSQKIVDECEYGPGELVPDDETLVDGETNK
ncbi:hypothetical protein EC988_002022, partial [Linderina pennispora]